MKKLILDPDADGLQWFYRDMTVIYQNHPLLKSYGAFDGDKWIGHSETKTGIKKEIDKYLTAPVTAH